mmetsp:Transcript_9153/g.15668  ORF Transcript_9153/g.15668 Transcript_9153/m.15668 type:complete len:208 (+) Transcript_9153:140-763(+)
MPACKLQQMRMSAGISPLSMGGRQPPRGPWVLRTDTGGSAGCLGAVAGRGSGGAGRASGVGALPTDWRCVAAERVAAGAGARVVICTTDRRPDDDVVELAGVLPNEIGGSARARGRGADHLDFPEAGGDVVGERLGVVRTRGGQAGVGAELRVGVQPGRARRGAVVEGPHADEVGDGDGGKDGEEDADVEGHGQEHYQEVQAVVRRV